MHRRDASCYWCPERSTRSWRSPIATQAMAAALALAVVGAGTWSYGIPIQNFVARAWTGSAIKSSVASVASVASVPSASSVEPAHAADSIPRTVHAVSAGVASLALVATASTAAPVLDPAVDDSVQWVPAVARTWVNVRNDAGRTGDVVGVIKPASRAMLGMTGPSGWRRVRSDGASGWVDARLFRPDSSRTSG